MGSTAINNIDALEGVVGKTPGAMHLKVIDHLDQGALRWIAAAPVMFAGFAGPSGIRVTMGGGKPGFVRGDARELRLPVDRLDEPGLASPGASFGSLFLIPGIGETLRVNGKVMSIDADEICIAAEECYGHCAKALIRSDLWAADPVVAVPGDAEAFIAASRFLALATVSADGAADLSPKGDPAGWLARFDGDSLWFADRPGNRRVDSFRNIVAQPRVALALLIPGSDQVAIMQGQAQLTTNEIERERFAVQGKTPLLAIRVDPSAVELRHSPALARARLWPVAAGTHGIEPAKLFVEHIKLNKAGGVGATLARASLSLPGVSGLLKKGLDKDYKDNLY